MNYDLIDKWALVVGASKSLGRAVAETLARQGAKVMAVARSAQLLESIGLEESGGATFAGDMTVPADRARLLDRLANSFGLPDIVVHAMGGSLGIRDPLAPSADLARVWDLNLGAAHEINRHLIPAMLAKGWGRIVHFSSNGVGLATGNAGYTSAKGAVEAYVRVMAKQYGKAGVVMTAVAPGPFDNGYAFIYKQDAAWTKAFMDSYVPMGRWGLPEECAKLVAFLCSDAASYMAGAVVPVDGGMR